MKSIGTILVILGVAAIIYGFMDRAPTVLSWMYNWGDSVAWMIKIGLVVLGVVLYIIGSKRTEVTTTTDTTNP